MLYASRRVAVTAQSGVLEVHVHGVVERILCARTVSVLKMCFVSCKDQVDPACLTS